MRRLMPLLLSVLAGCSRVTVDAEVRADGSMKRTLTFGGSEPSFGEPDAQKKPGWEETFKLPNGAGWTVKRAKDSFLGEGQETYVASREVPVGTAFEGDVTIRSEGGNNLATNSGRVTARGDGTFEYVETVKWLGKRDTSQLVDPESRARIKAALPPGSNTETIDNVHRAAMTAMVKTLFGPGDPALDQLLTHQELAVRRMERAVMKAIRPYVPDDAAAMKVVKAGVNSNKNRAPSPANPGGTENKDSTKGGPASVLYLVRFPGQVTETNGVRDEDGTIYWRFYSEAAALEDITLRAVFRP